MAGRQCIKIIIGGPSRRNPSVCAVSGSLEPPPVYASRKTLDFCVAALLRLVQYEA